MPPPRHQAAVPARACSPATMVQRLRTVLAGGAANVQAQEDARLSVLEEAAMEPRIAKVVQFVQANLDRRFRLSELAASVGVSESRLWRLFREQTGASPGKYLTQQRIQTAGKLLDTTSLSVKQITYAVGFDDESHFIRAFKRIWGLTPGEFRRRTAQAESDKESARG